MTQSIHIEGRIRRRGAQKKNRNATLWRMKKQKTDEEDMKKRISVRKER